MKLVFATHNPNKLLEIQSLMPSFEIRSLPDLGCTEEIVEDADTIKGNALLKARFVMKNYELACFADDTGLEVDALGGAPGVYSARYAGEQKSGSANMAKLLDALKDKKDRSAHFKTVIALCMDGREYSFEGICNGQILDKPRGIGGFGYDPIFLPDDQQQTFAEMPLELKGHIGHRGKAIKKLLDFLREYSADR